MATFRRWRTSNDLEVTAQHFKGEWTITITNEAGEELNTLTDRETPTNDAVRIFLNDQGVHYFQDEKGGKEAISELLTFIKEVAKKEKYGNGY
ncbi:hypothetical protein A2962_01775 [Candidatus Woesebacteria bacterium RIFCSPLOWO2_01_FULL_39_61]|uniref:Uncharacterized protein n=1 Tax=Candidatus Woesebacteria bacterium RIFCSPHIGHO2_02_FULL_39_13 TaxID=1802505 RepID=A0A1F7Z4A1_9BACT|nr:MAG: hypothetical protein A2692_02775 [Candidatus Woesebacteria bacterium RIFCSPHIGHO2_01_FULL_39_95]OGM33718.1 MAG: hypothetical protein A3D01_06275 [Candidatus Woesebacteria bacterium RIFCSPHIGHO2_02_FULL_39_13]OGM66761.1 MAG: hypothetical protein A2962_01775 [Candidatus Woesebacteria bacterium RIFCSPLOWO2_01_FULL_39_61]OGM74744.1 MAG: hypothetical protein A3H19_00180 [Candidatus Woesebacteria bacterium RIFCSPLOWO2_12_FULL_39_9]